MANPQIKIKRSSVAGKIPTADQLLLGELAVNTYDGKVFASKNVGIGTTVFTINPWTAGVGTNAYNTYFTEGNVGIGNTLPTSKLSVTGSASISGILTADQVYTSNNGNGTNIRIGDDLWIGDINVANTARFSGAQNSDRAFIVFGNSDTVALGRTASAALYYGGDFTVAGVVTATSGFSINSSGIPVNLNGVELFENFSNFFVRPSGNGGVYLKSANGGVDLAKFEFGGASILYYNNAAKFETTNSGVIVTGITTSTSGFSGNLTGEVNAAAFDTNPSGVVIIGVATATTFSGTTINTTTGNIVTGVITNAQGTNINYSGIATVGSLNIGATQVISSARQLQNIASLDATTTATIESAIAAAPNNFNDLNVTGISTFTNGPVLIGSGTSTGTVSQRLQVTGGGYVSGNLGIGSAIPSSLLTVQGDTLIVGLVTANSFRARGGAPGGLGVNNNGYGFFGSGDNDSGMYSSADGQVEFYSNSQEAARFTSNQNFLIGSISETGTASQRLQVTGGAYVSGNLGVNNTNPTSRLSVTGDGNFSGVVTATTFNGQVNAGVGTITTLSGITASYGTINVTIGNIVTGVITNSQGTNINYSGIGTITTLNTTNSSATNCTGTNLNITGIGTVNSLNIGATQVISSARQLQNIASLDATTTATIEAAVANAPNTFTDLQVTGISTFTNGPVIIGAATSTGTASQRLQVTGGSYFSGNLGINTTNPTENLSVLGKIQIQQDAGSNNRLIFRGQPSSLFRWSIDNNGSANDFRIFREDDATTANGVVYLGISTGGNVTATTFSGTTVNATIGNVVTGVITNAQGTNINYSGIGTIGTLNSTSGTITTLNGTTASYATGNFTTGNIVTGIITNAQGTNLNYSGIGTVATFNATNSSVTNRTGTNLNINGIGTIATLTSTTGTITNLGGTNINYSGVGTVATFNATNSSVTNRTGTNLNVTGIGTITTLSSTTGTITNAQGTNINYSGIGTIATFNATSSSVTSRTGTNLNISGVGTIPTVVSTTINATTGNIVTGVITNAQGTNLNYSGISTLSSVLSGNINSSGVVTATSFVGSGANLTSLNATQLTSGTVPGARITSSGGDFTVGNNLFVNGVLSVGGTSVILNAAQLRINDKDITLGITTDALGNDVSNDNTANHGGISVASTVGTPIISIPTDAANNDPSTYKQIMWVKQGHYSGFGTDAWILNYGVSIGNTSTVQTGSRLTVGAGFTVYDTVVDLQNLRTVNINSSGIGTVATLNSTTGTITTLSGTTASYGTANVTTGNIVTGIITNAQGTNLSYSGISTLGSLNVSQGSNLTTLRVTGISTLGQTTTSGLSNTGVSTLGNANATTLNVSGISTLSTISLSSADVTSTTTTTTTITATAIASISTSTYRSAVFQIQAVQATNYNMTTINVLHDGVETYMTEYGTINQPVGIATYSTDINSGSLRLLAYPASINSTTFRVISTGTYL